MSDAIVVGSGPNGLACAAVLAKAGVAVTVYEAADTIGGGTRTTELTEPGLLHDHCSAVHPMGTASPVFRELDLTGHGLEWCWPEIDLAHPLDGGGAAVMVRSIDETAKGLGVDGRAWRAMFGTTSAGFEALNEDLVEPIIHWPKHPLKLARFGLPTLAPASVTAKRLSTPEGKALWGGAAAHSFSPLTQPMSSAIGMALVTAGHSQGWPMAKGGSRAITDALASVIEGAGGRIETGRLVRSIDELPAADAVVLDVGPKAVIEMAGDRLPVGAKKAYARYRYGPGSFKLDLAVEGGIPWTNEACRRAGTVHVAGTFEEMVHAEAETNRGRMPERPYILLAQQYLADTSRSSGDLHPVWAYAHVPNGFPGDATDAMLDQIERFAPGLRDRIISTTALPTSELPWINANYVGGDIACGANTPRQLISRPRPTLNPYRTGAPGIYLCSAATPPGAGVHGMGGANAARTVLADLDRR